MMMLSKGLLILLVAGCTLVALASAKELPKRETPSVGSNFDISSSDISNADDESNDLLLNYDPYEPRKTDYKTQSRNINSNNKLKSGSYIDGERESVSASEVRPVSSSVEPKGAANVDRVKDIAQNSREIRLVGPNQREVEMRDDVASKLVVALENLQKEAGQVWGQVNEKLDKSWTDLKRSEVWGQVNEKLDKGWTDIKRAEVWGQVNDKLDKGWTDLKSMVEGVVSPSSSKQQASSSGK